MHTGFIKRIIQATENLDTSIYLHSASFNEATALWVNDLSEALDSVVHIFEHFDLEVSASFMDKRSAQIHAEYLDKLTKYVEGVDLALTRKALQYAQIAIKLNGPKEISTDVLENIKEAKTYLEKLKASLEKVTKFSRKLMVQAKGNRLTSLPEYTYQFTRLALFEQLTLDLVIKLLKEKAEI